MQFGITGAATSNFWLWVFKLYLVEEEMGYVHAVWGCKLKLIGDISKDEDKDFVEGVVVEVCNERLKNGKSIE